MENVLVIGLKRNNESFIEFLFLNKLIHFTRFLIKIVYSKLNQNWIKLPQIFQIFFKNGQSYLPLHKFIPST